jgi:hypothetical protein
MTRNMVPYRIRLKPRYVAHEPRMCRDNIDNNDHLIEPRSGDHFKRCMCPECAGGLPERPASRSSGDNELTVEEVAGVLAHVPQLRDRYTQLMTESHVGFVRPKRASYSESEANVQRELLFETIRKNPGLSKHEYAALTGLSYDRIIANMRMLHIHGRVRPLTVRKRPQKWALSE